MLTEPAFTARDYDAIDNAISNFPLFCRTADLLYHTAELATEDVCLYDYAVNHAQVAFAESRACGLDDNVVVFEELGLADLFWEAVLVARPLKRLMAIRTNANITLVCPYQRLYFLVRRVCISTAVAITVCDVCLCRAVLFIVSEDSLR